MDYNDSGEQHAQCLAEAENCRKNSVYLKAMASKRTATSETGFLAAASLFDEIIDYNDAGEQRALCLTEAENCRKNVIYNKALGLMGYSNSETSLSQAMDEFKKIPGWRDSDNKIAECRSKLNKLRFAKEMAEQEAEKEKKKK